MSYDDKNTRLEELREQIINSRKEREAENYVDNFYARQKRLLCDDIQRKKKHISLRICEEDLLRLKERALEERMPYQTLVTRLIAKYLKGEIEVKGV